MFLLFRVLKITEPAKFIRLGAGSQANIFSRRFEYAASQRSPRFPWFCYPPKLRPDTAYFSYQIIGNSYSKCACLGVRQDGDPGEAVWTHCHLNLGSGQYLTGPSGGPCQLGFEAAHVRKLTSVVLAYRLTI